MVILRLLAVLTVALVAGNLLAYLLTGNARFVRYSWLVFKVALGAALLTFALLIAERLLVAL